MKRAAIIIAASIFFTCAARAEEAPLQSLFSNTEIALPPAKDLDTKKELRGTEPGWFTTLGSPKRTWEIRTDTAFSTNRAFTSRVELAHFFGLSQYFEGGRTSFGERFGLVVRASFGLADDTTSGIYNPLGPLPAIGFRFRTPSDAEWIEFGARALIPYPGPSNALPGMQDLAFKAAISSGIADDAAWLPLDSWGSQLYLATQARTSPLGHIPLRLAIGVAGGGAISLGTVELTTWLGPQPSFIGNAYFEAFAIAQRWASTKLNLQVGAHAEVSLSACWPGRNALPFLVNGFVAWSPVPAFALRLFYGAGESVQANEWMQEYGVRAQIFVP